MREAALKIVKTLQDNGFVAVFAGGFVRDMLLGRESNDIDVATSATPQQVLDLFPHSILDGFSEGVIKVITDKVVTDVATLRLDSNASNGRKPDSVEFTNSLKADSRRRDFSINSMYFDPISEELFDFHGGQEDLRREVITTVGDPSDRFQEDALRMLRAIRFSCQLGFRLDFDLSQSCRDLKHLVNNLSAERVRDEFFKILSSDRAKYGIGELIHTGLLQEILPEVSVHRKFAGLHLLALGGVDVETRFASLFLNQFEAADACNRLKLSGAQFHKVITLLEQLDFAHDATNLKQAALVNMMRGKHFPYLAGLQFAQAKAMGLPDHLDFFVAKSKELRTLVLAPPLLDGNDLIAAGLKPGPLFKTMLDWIRREQDSGRISTCEQALEMLFTVHE